MVPEYSQEEIQRLRQERAMANTDVEKFSNRHERRKKAALARKRKH